MNDRTPNGNYLPSTSRDTDYSPVDDYGLGNQLRPYPVGYEALRDDDEDGLDIRRIFGTLFRYKWLILALVLISSVASVLFTLRQTPMFRANATIEVQREERQIIEGANVDPMTIADAEFMATQIALLQSRSLAERVVETLDLASSERYSDQTVSRQERTEEAAGKVLQNLSISTITRSRIIEIRFVSPSPQETADVVNTLAEEFIASNLQRKYNSTAYAREFLKERLSTTKTTLEESERALQAYAREQDIINLNIGRDAPAGGSLSASTLIELNKSLTNAEADRIALEQRYREAQRNSDISEVITNETIQDFTGAVVALQAEYDEKLSIFKPGYPDMLALKAKINGLQALIGTEKMRIVRSIETDYRSAHARERSLRSRIADLTVSVQDLKDREINYNILMREVDTNRSQYEALLQRLKEVSIAGGIGSNQVSIVDKAYVPRLPFSPNLLINALMGFILGLGFGVGLAMLLSKLDDKINAPEDVKEKLGMPALGVIPKASTEKTIQQLLRDPRSPVTESYYSLRATLEFASPGGTPKSVALTSCRPSEGKSSSILGLATSFAATGKTVLVIDGDMRKPAFMAPREDSIGFSGLLTDPEAKLSEQTIQQQDHHNLFLLPAGILPPNPPELLATPRWRQILDEAEAQFDIVLIDSPPLLGFADALLLARQAKACIMVTQAGNLRTPIVRSALERLLDNRVNVLGFLISKFNAKRHGYGYGFGYGYGGYGHYGDKAQENKKVAKENDSADEKRRINMFLED